MIRRLFTVTSALSLLLCVIMVGLWARGYYAFDQIDWLSASAPAFGSERFIEWEVRSGDGGIRIDRTYHLSTSWVYSLVSREHRGWKLSLGLPPSYPGTSSYDLWNESWGDRDSVSSGKGILFPIWVAVVATLVLPAASVLIRRGRKQQRGGKMRCPACGYDLRASPDRCPECGTQVPRKL